MRCFFRRDYSDRMAASHQTTPELPSVSSTAPGWRPINRSFVCDEDLGAGLRRYADTDHSQFLPGYTTRLREDSKQLETACPHAVRGTPPRNFRFSVSQRFSIFSHQIADRTSWVRGSGPTRPHQYHADNR